jgi:hypothetical protein
MALRVAQGHKNLTATQAAVSLEHNPSLLYIHRCTHAPTEYAQRCVLLYGVAFWVHPCLTHRKRSLCKTRVFPSDLKKLGEPSNQHV